MGEEIVTEATARDALRSNLSYYVTPFLLAGTDFFVFFVAMQIVLAIATASLGSAVSVQLQWFVLLPALQVCCMFILDLYRTRRVFHECAKRIVKAATFATVLSILVDYTLHPSGGMLPPSVFLGYWTLSFVLDWIARYALRSILRKAGIWQSSVIIVGAGKTAERFVKAFHVNYHILGFIEDNATRPLLQRYAHLGGFEELETIIQRYRTPEVVLAIPGLSRREQVELFYRAQPFVRKVSLIPDLFDVPIGTVQIENSIDDRLLVLKTTNNLTSHLNRFVKRAFDIVMGSVIAILIAPVLLLLAIWIRMDSDGSACYNAERIGKGGRSFRCYKFRSMYPDADRILMDFLARHPEAAEEWRVFQKLRGEDPRVTRAGKIIRKYSLDELPQIFNVIKGDMSLVGPRPYLPREKAAIGEYLPVICMTRPGITGLWQVSGRNDIEFDGRLRLDAWYVRNWNLWQDIVLLFKTVGVVFWKKGAY